MSKGRDEDKNEEDRKIKEVESEGSQKIGGSGQQMRNSFFHPGGGNLRNPNQINDKKSKQGFEEKLNEHIPIIYDRDLH
ncbi:MAG: hypothetical protein UX82_C0007G0004 [Microgenomates group bacterium GW2011_GWE1_47_12]|nr:MAG: hypothetical protein UX32_C0006G0011 [Microgenomates group bacterium GW2011_GWF1_46_12]KKU44950.1 MAG: hypothetical protein UX63_C0016G0016 [Microgenomates group bacterium GW2011_GWB1_46_7]KKU60807.1 MAG: hypothetical protein UX82_C0007G0004 [Microgenomates group bacterium GW2011_GWE1_47_12]KKU62782.1 MAG: hypothetical protein UX84_C0002G0043 [Microgenomates group bacterium GW2011_GWD1_47_13]